VSRHRRIALPTLVSSNAARSGPVFLVAVPDRVAADRLPAAAAQARRAGARLLVALARPRPGFTTDAVIARHVAVTTHEDLLRLQQVTHQMLNGSGVDYEIVRMTYRDSRDPDRRQRRIATASVRLARRRGATPLPDTLMRTAAQPAAHAPASSGRPPHVVAVLPDSADAVRVARAAADIALATGRPLALVVPLPAVGSSYDPDELSRGYARLGEDMDAIAARVRPTLDLIGIRADVYCAPYRTDPVSAGSRAMAAAVEDAARRLRSQAIVFSAGSEALPHLWIPAEVLHVVGQADEAHPGPAAPILAGHRPTGC